MSHEMSGSEKLKAQCQTMASLTPEEISQIAGAASYNYLSSWLIRGIPVDIYGLNQVNTTINPQVSVHS